MTALQPRGWLLALALSLAGGLTACTASPRFPVVEGEAPGGGIEPLQPRYAVSLAEAGRAAPPADTVAPEPPPAAAPIPRETAPRAAPAGEVSSADLPPPAGASTLDTAGPAAPPPSAAAAPPPSAPAQAPIPPPAASVAGLGPPASAGEVAPAPGATARGFIQRDGTGPGRFTIGAPASPPAVAAPPGPDAPRIYARPSAPPSSAPPPSASVAAPAPAYARPTLPPAAPAYARPPAASSAAASPRGLPGGPRPYTSLFPQGPTLSTRGVRSAGIRSTPSDPGIAPQVLSATPETAVAQLAPGEAASRGRGRFVWPVKGALLSGFGDKGGGVRNDGLNIAANQGDPVRAAAAGEVVYAGNQVPGSGNLVLVKHPGGWVTEYAHLSRIEVRNRDPVVQGQELGQAGQTGAVDRPQLHFEIRFSPSPEVKAAPVDPAALLPSG